MTRKYNPGLAEKFMRRIAEEEKKSKAPVKNAPSPAVNTGPAETPVLGNPGIVLSDYIPIPNTSRIISKFELAGYNEKNFDETHFKLHENGLYMPTISQFMPHFANVVESYKSNGRKPLLDASGNVIKKRELKDIALHMLKNHIAIYGSVSGAWTWLDARFENGEILSDHRTQVQNGVKTLIPQRRERLERCLTEDCFTAFNSLNSQGLPTQKSGNQSYNQGENIYFWHPRNGMVAGFSAYVGRTFLVCDRDPSDSGSSLGVYAVSDAKT